MQLTSYADLSRKVVAVLGQLEARLLALVPYAEIVHVGSTAIPGAITKGDVDVLTHVPGAGAESAFSCMA